MKILVTGGTGYIGSHTVVELQIHGYDVIIIDNLSNSTIDVIDSIEQITRIRPQFEKIELCDKKQTENFFKRNVDISGVIHFAAYKAVGESVLFPLKYYQNNLVSLINLLACLKQFSINKIVFSSSCTVYGQPDKLPVSERSPIGKPLSPYGNTKKISEEIITDETAASELNAILLRYFNPIGAHESALIGEKPSGIPNNLVPYITQTAIGKREFLRVFGNDYDTPDGTCIRDYIYVGDLAKAHVLALNRLLKQQNTSKCEIFNLGTGQGNSVLEVIRAFEKVSGVKLNYKIVERRAGDVDKIWADPSLANRLLNWKTEKNLEDMMLTAWKWEKHLAKQHD